MPSFLKIDFLHGSDAVAITHGRVIKSMLTGHPYANGPLPPGVCGPEQLGEVIDRLQAACDDAKSRDVHKITYRNNVRIEYNNCFRNLAHHLEILANGDVSKLQNVGFEVRSDPRKAKAMGPLPALELTVKRGPLPGIMVVHFTALPGAAMYELQIATGDPTREESWAEYAKFVHLNNEMSGFTAGQTYWFRGRAVGASGNGGWSAPFPMMSL